MNNNLKNILVTGAGGSYSIYWANKSKDKYNVFLVDGSDQNAGPYLDLPFAKIPFGNHPDFLKKIDELVKEWKIDYIISGVDEELLSVSRYCQDNPHLIPIIPSYDFIDLCLNKKKLMTRLAELDISRLSPFNNLAEVVYPAIAKPIYGRGSRQVHTVKNQSELEGYLQLYQKKFFDLLVQPYIQGEEYTVSVICNNQNQLIGIVPKKIILKRGITRAAVVEKNDIIDKVCRKIVDLLNPAGIFNVQLKLFRDKVYIFEINPRLSTTSVLTDQAFGDEVDLFIKYYNQEKIIDTLEIKDNIYLYRYEENIFISA